MAGNLTLFLNIKEKIYFLLLCFTLFSFNIFFVYNYYLNFTANEVYNTQSLIVNLYPKEKYDVLKLKSDEFEFFTSIPKNHDLKKNQYVDIYLLTGNISFFEFLKGFYAKSFNIKKIESSNNALKNKLYRSIADQHSFDLTSSLYGALFLAVPVEDSLKNFFADLGISHLIAISGFHLGIIGTVLYFLFNILYSSFHQKFFPYRNKKFDISVTVSVILFFYLILTQLPPSLLRSFAMFVFALFLLRSNIKIFSFETLFIIAIILIALFPKLLLSLSFWFSISGVFYIYLYINYFKNLNKYLHIVFFNFWIFFAMNPVVHYFFANTSPFQLISPLLSLFFTIFYPVTLALHFLDLGFLFDGWLMKAFAVNISSYEVLTPFWLFFIYIAVSLWSIFNRYIFYILNAILISFNLNLYLFQ